MTWITPKTWADQDLVTANDLNTHLRDNLNALKAPPTAHYEANEASDYTTTSTSFTDVDNPDLIKTIETTGGDVVVSFHGRTAHSAGSSGHIYFEINVDGTPHAGDDGMAEVTGSEMVSFSRLITGLSAQSHTFALRWKTNAATATLYAGAGTAPHDVHPQFWVREVS